MLRNLLRRIPMTGIGIIPAEIQRLGLPSFQCISTSCANYMPYEKNRNPAKWPRYNTQVFPPTEIGEKQRPAYVCHMINNVKYPAEKMWWVACLIRGMSIDEALRQLDYVKRKGAGFIKKTLLEAQEIAVQQHNVEFRSNLWVAESFSGKGFTMKGIRRHARKRYGIVEYKYCHYFVRLEEGPPPEHYYDPMPDGPTLLQKWIEERRSQRIMHTL